jgi:hypothetical protein
MSARDRNPPEMPEGAAWEMARLRGHAVDSRPPAEQTHLVASPATA